MFLGLKFGRPTLLQIVNFYNFVQENADFMKMWYFSTFEYSIKKFLLIKSTQNMHLCKRGVGLRFFKRMISPMPNKIPKLTRFCYK